MIDYEMTRLCAEAMGYWPTVFTVAMQDLALSPSAMWVDGVVNKGCRVYDPLHDDAQAMALVKKFELAVCPVIGPKSWCAYVVGDDESQINNTDLNRAIVECVAKMKADCGTEGQESGVRCLTSPGWNAGLERAPIPR
jgi:hypothetical protein